MKKYLAIAAAGGALAIGVPAAIAATGAPSSSNGFDSVTVQSATPTPDADQQRPNRDDCPDKGGPNGGGSGQVAPDDSDTAAL